MSRKVITSSATGTPGDPGTKLLKVVDLKTHFRTERGTVRAVDGVSLNLDRGRTLGVVGESGSGKTILSRSIMGLLPKKHVVREGHVFYEGNDIIGYSQDEMRSVWGAEMSMVFQDPMTSLNPVMRIGKQITESLIHHLKMDKGEANETALALLTSVGIPEPAQRLTEYPHQLSGGMRQRVTIAIALACGPKLLFADEPTTALDVTVQAQILNLLEQQQKDRHMAMILVTHDLGVVAGRTDEIAVMYGGKIVETGADRRALQRDADALHRGPGQLDPQARAPQPHPPRLDPGPPARPGEPAQGLQLRASVPVRPAAVPRGGAAAHGVRDPRALVPVLVPGRHPRGRRGPRPERGRRHHRVQRRRRRAGQHPPHHPRGALDGR